jgi:LAS superfamily LD-carboxypeptidase LdcB
MTKEKNKNSGSNKSTKHIDPTYWAVLAVFIILASALFFISKQGNDKLSHLSEQISLLDNKLNNVTASLKGDIDKTESELASALEKEKQNVVAVKKELEKEIGSFEKEVGTISSSVSTLEKLSKTDPELLQKYSKVFFLNEHYEPPRLVEVPDNHKYDEDRSYSIHAEVWPYLGRMLDESSNDNQEIYIFSAFRSFDTQEALKGQYTVVFGEGTANQFSADQGYSEHQLGTTVDFITTGIGGTLEGFEETPEYSWLLDNAHKYGFVLSYPENNDFYVFEPWHWRFVGVDLAIDLYNTRRDFYDLDQREIDEYLVNIFD